jgi:hypothetical protein
MPIEKSFYIFLLLSVQSFVGRSQQQLFGKVRMREPVGFLAGAVATNISKDKKDVSDRGGYYKVVATKGDTITFSCPGYFPDTVIASDYYLAKGFTVTLTSRVRVLPSFQVDEKTNYQLDSMQRRDEYGYLLNARHPVTLMNEKRPKDGPGLSVSPLGYFSKTEKSKRRLKKRLADAEKEYYIDYKFSPVRVAQLTGLKGDSLQLFLTRYRPSYQRCRNSTNLDMMLYVNDKLKLFKQNNED